LLAIGLACVSLFPCVSSSDDSIRFQYFESTHADPHQPSGDQTKQRHDASLATLIRLLEALESVQISAVYALSVWLTFFGVALFLCFSGRDQVVPLRCGRSPPVFL